MRCASTRNRVPLLVATACAFACACASPAPPGTPTHGASVAATPVGTDLRPHPSPTPRATDSPPVPTNPAPSRSPGATGASHLVETEDGSLAVAVPEGASADPAAITVLSRGADDLPPELEGLQVRSAFHEIAPAGMVFAAPVTITRRVSFTDLEADPSDGVPLLVLAIRSADGSWEWLGDQTLQRTGDRVVVTGVTAHTGTVFAFGGRASTDVAVNADVPVVLGDSRQLSATLRFPDVSQDPPLLGTFEPLISGDFVQVGGAEGPANDRLSQLFVCAGAGTTTIGIRYVVLNVGAETALFDQLGLDPVSTRVEATTQLTCVGNATPAPS